VKQKEPGTLRYSFLKQTNASGGPAKVVVIERYKDAAAIKAHGQFPEFKEANRALKREGLLAGPSEIIVLEEKTGFASRL